jgi:hypothetical protein
MMAGPFDDSLAFDQTTPWAPKVPLASPPSVAQSDPSQAKITPETHPQYFNAPANGALKGKLEQVGQPAPSQPASQPAQTAQAPATGKPASSYMSILRQKESGGNDSAYSPSTGASGRYQFLPKTWLGVAAAHPELGLRPEDIWNGEKQDQALAAMTADNARILKENGLNDDPGNLHMLHFLGTGGGPKFLKAMETEPTSSAAMMFPLEAKYNPTIFYHDGDPNQPRTLGQVYGLMTKDFGGATVGGEPAPAAAKEADMPAPTAAPAEEQIVLPPLPAGLTPIKKTAPNKIELPPLPAGLMPIMTSKQAYDEDVKGSNSSAAQQPPRSSFDEMKEETKELLSGDFKGPAIRRDLSNVVGVGSGMLQGVTGLGEAIGMLPFSGSVGQRSAEATKFLQGYGNPEAQRVGTTLDMAFPVGEGINAVKTGAKTIMDEGPAAITTAKSALKGALGAGAASAMTPTGEIDPGKRAEEKLEDIALGAAGGGLIGAAAPQAAGAVKWVKSKVSDYLGKDLNKISEELRTGMNAETGKIMTAAEKDAKDAEINAAAARIKAESEDNAVAAQEAKAAEAQAAKDAKIAEHAAKPVSTPEELGDQIHDTVVADIKKMEEERRIGSGFENAVNSDGGKPSVPTKDFIDRAAGIIKDTKSDELKATLSNFRSSLTNKSEDETVKAVSIRQAREVLVKLNSKLEELGPNDAHRVKEIRDDFLKHLESTHPQMKVAREKYAELSEPLRVYERTGALKKVSEKNPYSGESILDPTVIKRIATNGTEASAKAMERMVDKNKAIRDSLRNVFHGEIKDKGELTAKRVDDLVKKNRLVLKSTGLHGEFEKLRDDLRAVESSAKTEGDKATEMRRILNKGETRKSIEDLSTAKTKALETRKQFDDLDTRLTEARTPREVASEASSTVKALNKLGHFSKEEYGDLLNKIKDIGEKAETHEDAVRFVRQATRAAIIGAIGAAGFGGAGYYFSHRITPGG